MENIYFSFVIYVDNDELLRRSVNSIIHVSNEMLKKVKIIIADAANTETSISFCEELKYKLGEKNFCCYDASQLTIGEAYNLAIPQIRGRYVNFSLASTWFQVGAIETLWNIAEELERPKIVSLAPWTLNEKEEYLQYKMSPSDISGMYSTIKFSQQPEKLQLMFHAYFFRCYIFNSKERNTCFKAELQEDALVELLLNLLAEYSGYLYLPKLKLNYTVQMEDSFSAFPCQHQKWWYIDSIKNWMLPLAEKWSKQDYPLRKHIRIALLYLIYVRYNCNYNDRNKSVLDEKEVQEFLQLSGKVFRYIDNALIWNKKSLQSFVIPRTLKILFLKMKAEQNKSVCEAVVHDNQLCLWTHRKDIDSTENTQRVLDDEYALDKDVLASEGKEVGFTTTLFTIKREDNKVPELKWAYDADEISPVCDLRKEHVILKAINYKEGKLEIDGMFSLGDFLEKDSFNLKVYKDGKEIDTEYSQIYGLRKIFGIAYCRDYQFHVSIPIFSLREKSEIQFGVVLNDKVILLEIRTASVYAHVNSAVKGQYWNFNSEWCLSFSGKNKLILSLVDSKELKQKETLFRKELTGLAAKGNAAAKRALNIRKKYFELKEQCGKQRIWITYDKLYKAGDNGEYLYRYISEQNDDIRIYYLIQDWSPDYERMKEQGENILVWGQDDTLATVLLAEAVLTTHASVYAYTGFEKEMIPYISDLFNPTNICIQHGLTTQSIAQYQNRLVDNLQLYICASPNEIQNLSHPIYGYEESMLRLTGVARYDGLKSNDQKQILITPTWRRYIANSSKMGSKRSHNDYFKESEYYRVYNSLINDDKLIKCAKKNGYKLIYLLHPTASAQIDDFDKNEYVDIIPAAGDMSYEKILTESSLMVTDYSGVQFDFAYMKKPVLYYHPNSLPPHFEESDAFIYERDAFGPLIDNHEDMVTALCEYMENKCKMKKEYVERVDKFFEYNDFGNCERIYHTILEFLDEKRENQ